MEARLRDLRVDILHLAHPLSCPIAVQRCELEAARQPHYTVAEWAKIPEGRARIVDGDLELCSGVRLMLTPGHTPGHESVVIDTVDGTTVIAAQCIFRRAAWRQGVETNNLDDNASLAAADDSLARLRASQPRRVLLSHDLELGFSRR
jgi:N-acyl homoserine lactone hydrolase